MFYVHFVMAVKDSVCLTSLLDAMGFLKYYHCVYSRCNNCSLWDVLKKKNKTVKTLKTVTAFIVKHERRRHKLSEGMKCRIEASR